MKYGVPKESDTCAETAQEFCVELDAIHAALLAIPPALADTPWREGEWKQPAWWATTIRCRCVFLSRTTCGISGGICNR